MLHVCFPTGDPSEESVLLSMRSLDALIILSLESGTPSWGGFKWRLAVERCAPGDIMLLMFSL